MDVLGCFGLLWLSLFLVSFLDKLEHRGFDEQVSKLTNVPGIVLFTANDYVWGVVAYSGLMRTKKKYGWIVSVSVPISCFRAFPALYSKSCFLVLLSLALGC
jgi:hypothetical protein